MDKVCDTEPRLKITKIMVTDKGTTVDCKYFYGASGKIKPGGDEALAVAPPGDAAAIYIAASGTGKKYKLLKVSGVPTLPDSRRLKDGDVVDFVLVFDRIDDDVRKIDIVEGDNKQLSNTWKFLNVPLK
jgi:hypothetical protein